MPKEDAEAIADGLMKMNHWGGIFKRDASGEQIKFDYVECMRAGAQAIALLYTYFSPHSGGPPRTASGRREVA